MKRISLCVSMLLCTLFIALIPISLVDIAQGQSTNAVNGASPNEQYLQDLMRGKVIPVNNYMPPANYALLPKITPPMGQDQLIMYQNESLGLPMTSTPIAAGYQVFNGGIVGAWTNSISDLVPCYSLLYATEWQVLHQWPSPGTGENAITIVNIASINKAEFGVYISALGGYQTGDFVYFTLRDTFTLVIEPLYSRGSTSYNAITFTIQDNSAGQTWTKTYSLSTTQYISKVDSSLEQYDTIAPNGLWNAFHGFGALDQNYNNVNLQNCFYWTEYTDPYIINGHFENFYNNGLAVDLYQIKTPT